MFIITKINLSFKPTTCRKSFVTLKSLALISVLRLSSKMSHLFNLRHRNNVLITNFRKLISQERRMTHII